jgi:hypothetical protein
MATAKWNVMVYMAGFNNLSTFATKDLQEMRKVGSTKDVKLTAFIKRLEQQSAHHIVVGKNGQGEVREAVGDIDSGSPQTMLDFVRWAVKKAPAERYALIVWNHGSGFDVLDVDQLYSHVRGGNGNGSPHVSPREIGLHGTQELGRSIFSTTVVEVLSQATLGDRAIASDDGTGHSLDTIELNRVVKKVHEDVIGEPLELLGMDACLMSNLEVAYEVEKHAKVVVGSEELEPGDGWPYTKILQDLNKDPGMDGARLGEVVVRRYVESYEDLEDQWPVTQCATRTAGVGGFVSALDGLATALRKHMKEHGSQAVQRAQMRSSYFEGELVDVRTMCRELRKQITSGPVHTAAGKVVEQLKENGGYVVEEAHLGDRVAGCGGVTVYWPFPMPGAGSDLGISPYYRDLRFARKGWDEFLRSYMRSVRA